MMDPRIIFSLAAGLLLLLSGLNQGRVQPAPPEASSDDAAGAPKPEA